VKNPDFWDEIQIVWYNKDSNKDSEPPDLFKSFGPEETTKCDI
jgi:hypothetical protein